MFRHNHYEVAFEAFLRDRRVPYLAIDEKKRSLLESGESLKNLDFVVHAPGGNSWLVDVKGRKFPSGTEHRSYWKHWTTLDDLVGMGRWQTLFGNTKGLFVFAYMICGARAPLPQEKLFAFRGELYAFVAITYFEYLCESHLISPRWKTYAMPTKKFRNLARPFEDFVTPRN